MRRTLLVIAIALAAVALGGCGTSDDRAEVRTVTERFLSAVGSQDGRDACAQLSEDTVTQLEQQEKGACDSVVTQLGVKPAAVSRVAVYSLSAVVELANGSTWYLDRSTDGWRISAVACRATQGEPRDHPLNCEVEA